MNDIFNEMTLGPALLFAASVILAYSLMAKRMEGYMFPSQYRRKRVGWMLRDHLILHGMSRLLNRLSAWTTPSCAECACACARPALTPCLRPRRWSRSSSS